MYLGHTKQCIYTSVKTFWAYTKLHILSRKRIHVTISSSNISRWRTYICVCYLLDCRFKNTDVYRPKCSIQTVTGTKGFFQFYFQHITRNCVQPNITSHAYVACKIRLLWWSSIEVYSSFNNLAAIVNISEYTCHIMPRNTRELEFATNYRTIN